MRTSFAPRISTKRTTTQRSIASRFSVGVLPALAALWLLFGMMLSAHATNLTPRDWSPAADIQGGTIQAGMVAPSAEITVVVGGYVFCSVMGASDYDTWTQHQTGNPTPIVGFEPDTLHYSWEDGGAGGTFNPDNDANTMWTAPQTTGTYTLTCTIDDTPAPINAPETGSRDDLAVTREVTVKVVKDSEATLKLYKDAALTQEATGGVVGGTVYIALELKIGAWENLVSSSAKVRVEENYEQHSETERRYETVMSLGAYGWQTSSDGTTWTDAAWASPQWGGPQETYWRKAIGWNTTTQPLGHNANHSISIVAVDGDANQTEIKFGGFMGGGYGNGPESMSTDVKNLVITNVLTDADNSDYITFSPDINLGLQNPTINFNIVNEGDPQSSNNRYQWWLWLRQTTINGPSNFATYEGHVSGPGQKTVIINATDGTYTKDVNLTTAGTYAFDIHVQDTKTGTWFGIRSGKITMPAHQLNYLQDPGANLQAEAGYYIESERDASSVRIDFIDPDLQEKKSITGATTKRIDHSDIPLYTFTDNDKGGTYIALFVAYDNYGESYRDHTAKPMLAINQRAPITPFNLWMDGETYPHFPSNIGLTSIKKFFKTAAGITMRQPGSTAGDPETSSVGGWSITYKKLTLGQQKANPGFNIIVAEHLGDGQGGTLDGDLGHFGALGDANLPPNAPGVAALSFTQINKFYGEEGVGWTEAQLSWMRANVLLHELTHGFAGDLSHCGDWFERHFLVDVYDVATPTCVIYGTATNVFGTDLSLSNTLLLINRNGSTTNIPSPWHSFHEINAMRGRLGLPLYARP